MHQIVYDPQSHAAYSRCVRPRPSGSGGGGGSGALGLSVLTSDPLIELVYRSGLLGLKDLRALMRCTGSEASW